MQKMDQYRSIFLRTVLLYYVYVPYMWIGKLEISTQYIGVCLGVFLIESYITFFIVASEASQIPRIESISKAKTNISGVNSSCISVNVKI